MRPAPGVGEEGTIGRRRAAGETRGTRYFAQTANPEGMPERLLLQAGAPPHQGDTPAP